MEELLKVAALLKDFVRPWGIAGGWAVDLFLGYVSRPHHDIEIALFREDQFALRDYLKDWQFQKIMYKRGLVEPWPQNEYLDWPTHQIRLLCEDENLAELDVLLNERDGSIWRFRKNREIFRPVSLTFRQSPSGLPYLSPEIVLLFKAVGGSPRPQDEQDFENVLALLEDEPRAWLKQSLEMCNPDSTWLNKL